MLEQPDFAIEDPARIRSIVRDSPWATLVTVGRSRGLVVTHCPVVVDERFPGFAVVGHLARRDPAAQDLGVREATLIFQGPHGYVSPRWYAQGTHVPTWDYIVVHLHGRPDMLTGEQTYQVLEATVDQLEEVMPDPWRLEAVEQYARRIVAGTVGFRLVPTRVVAKAKLHQDEPRPEALRIAAALDAHESGPSVLAAAIRGG